MDVINDDVISNLFFGKRQLLSKIYKEYVNNKNSDIYKYIINRFDDSLSFDESLYRIRFKIEKRPVCKNCGKELKFIKSNGKYIFNKFCSKKCSNNFEETKNKLKETCLIKYNTTNFAKSKQFKEKYIRHIQEKYNDNTIINAWQAKEVIDKIKEKCLIKYGVSNYGATNKHQCILKSIDVINKRNNTKRKNNTFNKSKPEDESYLLLKEKYSNIKRQYKCNAYPFFCDFYIPDLDLYIECNYHWTHGYHPYNPNNIEDQNKIELWKSKQTKYYDNAIKTWTNLDIRKRNIAKQNKLNYIEFWNIDELKKYLISK